MRIVCIGQAAFGERVLRKLTERGEEVVAVYTPEETVGKRNPVKEYAIQMGIPVFQPKSMRVPEVYEEYTRLKPDLNVMAFVTSILPDSILNYPTMGTIQYHPSLPFSGPIEVLTPAQSYCRRRRKSLLMILWARSTLRSFFP
jgi:methionyl-tRNA formyltransferase